MTARLLLLLLAAVGAGWLLRRLAGGPGGERTPPRGGRRPSPPRSQGTMVRDRVCNTFLPRARALRETVGGEEHFFCSEGCRRRFLEGAVPPTASGAGTG